jgi:hypothetical protein
MCFPPEDGVPAHRCSYILLLTDVFSDSDIYATNSETLKLKVDIPRHLQQKEHAFTPFGKTLCNRLLLLCSTVPLRGRTFSAECRLAETTIPSAPRLAATPGSPNSSQLADPTDVSWMHCCGASTLLVCAAQSWGLTAIRVCIDIVFKYYIVI